MKQIVQRIDNQSQEHAEHLHDTLEIMGTMRGQMLQLQDVLGLGGGEELTLVDQFQICLQKLGEILPATQAANPPKRPRIQMISDQRIVVVYIYFLAHPHRKDLGKEKSYVRYDLLISDSTRVCVIAVKLLVVNFLKRVDHNRFNIRCICVDFCNEAPAAGSQLSCEQKNSSIDFVIKVSEFEYSTGLNFSVMTYWFHQLMQMLGQIKTGWKDHKSLSSHTIGELKEHAVNSQFGENSSGKGFQPIMRHLIWTPESRCTDALSIASIGAIVAHPRPHLTSGGKVYYGIDVANYSPSSPKMTSIMFIQPTSGPMATFVRAHSVEGAGPFSTQ